MQPKTEYILTPKGYVRSSDVKNNIMINGDNYIIGENKLSQNKEILKIKLDNGISIRSPRTQVILTTNSGKTAEELNVGDKVRMDYSPIPRFTTDLDNIYLYNKGMILGCFKANGGYIGDEVIVKIDYRLDELRFFLQSAMRSYDADFKFVDDGDYYVGEIKDSSNIKHLLIDTNYDNFDMSKLGRNSKLGFISTYFTINGNITSNGWVIADDTDKNLLYDIQRVLMEFGMYSEVGIFKRSESYVDLSGDVKETRDIYRIIVYDSNYSNIGFLDHRMDKKLEKLNQGVNQIIEDKKIEQSIVSIEEDGEDRCYYFDVKGINNYNTNGVVILNRRN